MEPATKDPSMNQPDMNEPDEWGDTPSKEQR